MEWPYCTCSRRGCVDSTRQVKEASGWGVLQGGDWTGAGNRGGGTAARKAARRVAICGQASAVITTSGGRSCSRSRYSRTLPSLLGLTDYWLVQASPPLVPGCPWPCPGPGSPTGIPSPTARQALLVGPSSQITLDPAGSSKAILARFAPRATRQAPDSERGSAECGAEIRTSKVWLFGSSVQILLCM